MKPQDFNEADCLQQVCLEEMYRKYRVAFVHYADKMMSGHFYAEDVVHDVFVRLFLGDYYFVSEQAALGLIYKSIANRCIDLLRSVQSFESVCAMMKPKHSDTDIESELEYKELYRTVEKQIASLPPQCRKIFLLKYKREQTNPEIGELLGLSVRTVENQVYIARNILRKCIDL